MEIAEIHVDRRRVADAVKRADLTFMTMRLWFTSENNGQRIGAGSVTFLIRLLHLEPVVDDTGHLLSTKKRLADMESLQREILPLQYRTSPKGAGPMTLLRLDAPARGASKIKLLQGKIEVTTAHYKQITVEGLPAWSGKPLLGNPLLKGMRIEPVVKSEEDSTTVSLNITGQYNRLVTWDVRSNGRVLQPTSAGHGTRAGGKEESQSFRGLLPKDCSLRLTVVIPEKKRIYQFRFQNLELP